MYEKQWGRNCPGHLLFLIDQSGSMEGENSQKTAEAVQASILDIVSGCIDGTEVKDRAFITVIGYGKDDTAYIVREGWVSEWAKDVIQAKKTNTCIIPAEAYYLTPMAAAFELAKECINAWITARNEENGNMAAPIVINITDGFPDNEQSATTAAQDLMSINTPDGNVLLFNAHMSDDNTEILFPADETSVNGVHEGEFLFQISSPLTDKMVAAAKKFKFESVRPGSKGFVANARKATLTRFIQFGSVSQQ